MPIGWYLCDLVEASLLEQLHHELAAFCHPAILGGNRGLLDPLLQTLDCGIVVCFDLLVERLKILGSAKSGARRISQTCRSQLGSLQKCAAVYVHFFGNSPRI